MATYIEDTLDLIDSAISSYAATVFTSFAGPVTTVIQAGGLVRRARVPLLPQPREHLIQLGAGQGELAVRHARDDCVPVAPSVEARERHVIAPNLRLA